MSLGATLFSGDCDATDPTRQAALANLRSVGIAPVISSGNDGSVNSMNSSGLPVSGGERRRDGS